MYNLQLNRKFLRDCAKILIPIWSWNL